MIDLEREIKRHLDEELERFRYDRHERCASVLIHWLVSVARKKPVRDLDQRVESFSKAIRKMCKEMRVEYSKGSFVVKVNGSAEVTYNKLRLGTDWFEPDVDLIAHIMAGLDEQFGS